MWRFIELIIFAALLAFCIAAIVGSDESPEKDFKEMRYSQKELKPSQNCSCRDGGEKTVRKQAKCGHKVITNNSVLFLLPEIYI
ncbi:hypothetical protein [Erwinia sp. 9145]|uniref:hypothetical protein n=1 Tax=Erwinia sp. 9145 TaxID=1500895 RepID=UPI0012E02949|nr:hypothetical protein [Erwinia sp. 9145]